MRLPALHARAVRLRESVIARLLLTLVLALGAVGEAVRAACGFDCAFDHFPLVGRCPECSTYG